MMEKERSQLFEQLLEQNKGILFKVARTYCRDAADQQDLIQEIMVQLWQAFHKYDERLKFSTWFYRIALNVAISFYRKNTHRKSRDIPLQEQLDQLEDSADTEKEGHLVLLEQFINELNDLDKALILLYLEDKSHTEIAHILGISVSNVGTKIGRIKEKLKQRFSQHKNY